MYTFVFNNKAGSPWIWTTWHTTPNPVFCQSPWQPRPLPFSWLEPCRWSMLRSESSSSCTVFAPCPGAACFMACQMVVHIQGAWLKGKPNILCAKVFGTSSKKHRIFFHGPECALDYYGGVRMFLGEQPKTMRYRNVFLIETKFDCLCHITLIVHRCSHHELAVGPVFQCRNTWSAARCPADATVGLALPRTGYCLSISTIRIYSSTLMTDPPPQHSLWHLKL